MRQDELTNWHVIWGDGDLTLRIRSGSHLGEDESGEIRFRPPAQGCWLEFSGFLVLIALTIWVALEPR